MIIRQNLDRISIEIRLKFDGLKHLILKKISVICSQKKWSPIKSFHFKKISRAWSYLCGFDRKQIRTKFRIFD